MDGFGAHWEWACSVSRLDHGFPFSFSLVKPVYGWDLELVPKFLSIFFDLFTIV